MSDASGSKNEVLIKTLNPFHDCEFKWIIDNVSKFSRRLRVSFDIHSKCEPVFQLIAKFHERYTGISHVNIGVQRIDEGSQNVYVDVDISLVSIQGDVYKSGSFSFKSPPNEAPHYVFSEVFSTTSNKLKFATSFSSKDKDICEFERKGMAGSYGNCNRVYILPEDILIVKGAIKINGCCVVTSESPPTQEPIGAYKDYLLADFRSSYETNKLTDVELIVEDGVVKAHRFVLCSRSLVFRKMFEHQTKEKEEGKVYIQDISKATLDAFLWYLYTGIVQIMPFSETCHLYKVADIYEVIPLKKQCGDNLLSMMDEKTVCTVLSLADLHSDCGLKETAKEYVAGNFSKVSQTSSGAWEDLLRSCPALAAEILQEVSEIRTKPDYLRNWTKELRDLNKAAKSKGSDSQVSLLTRFP